MNIKILLTSTLIVASVAGSAQNRNMTYAITGDGNSDFLWMNIRQVDLSTGQVTKTVFQRSSTTYQITDLNTTKSFASLPADGNIGARNYPTATLVAAAAYDKRSNKLFFTPMRMAELRWLDLGAKDEQPHFYTLQPDAMKFGDANDEANHITRMTMGADGNGYAITNDANHLIRFTTGKMPVVTDLGNLVDAESNGTSIHNKCSSWGGDMIADAFGKLYVITASHNVFVIDIESRIATLKGVITGLPAGYTTNGAAVDEEGYIVVASANKFDGYFRLKLDDLAAIKMESSDVRYNASDLANSNLLLQKEADATHTITPLPTLGNAGEARVFPNPVTASSFNVMFDGKAKGTYTVLLTDLAGRVLQTRTVNVISGIQSEKFPIHSKNAKGMFLVKVLDDQKQVILTEKIVVVQ